MSENNLDLSDFSENDKKQSRIVNLKQNYNTLTENKKSQNSNKSLLIVEKLSQNKKKIGKYRNNLTNEELKLFSHNINKSIDIDENLAFNLANNIVKRRFKYFGKRNTEIDSDDNYEIKKRIIKLEKPLISSREMRRLQEEQKRKERERLEKERLQKERMERERLEIERREKEEKERKEKLRQKEMMKTIQINVEERNRQNHNYKIISKLTKEIVFVEDKPDYEKYRKETLNENYLIKKFKAKNEIGDLSRSTKTLIVSKSRPNINTKQIKIIKENNTNNISNKNININQLKIEVNKKTITKETKGVYIPSINSISSNAHQVNKIIIKQIKPMQSNQIENKKVIIVNKREENKKNNLTNKITVQKHVINKDNNFKTEENVRARYKNKKININI